MGGRPSALSHMYELIRESVGFYRKNLYQRPKSIGGDAQAGVKCSISVGGLLQHPLAGSSASATPSIRAVAKVVLLQN